MRTVRRASWSARHPFGRFPLAWLASTAAASDWCYVRGVTPFGLQHHTLCEASFILTLTAVLGLLGVPGVYRRDRLRTAGIDLVDGMDGIEFEELCGTLFEGLGYRVTMTPVTGDYGADLVCERPGDRLIVQAKRYDGTVGEEAIQQVAAARAHYVGDRALVVTNSHFTRHAVSLAATNGVELWDRDALVGYLAQQAAQPASMGVALLVRQVLRGVRLVATAITRVAGWVLGVALAFFGLRRIARVVAR